MKAFKWRVTELLQPQSGSEEAGKGEKENIVLIRNKKVHPYQNGSFKEALVKLLVYLYTL